MSTWKSIAEMGAVYLICGDSRLFRLFLRSQPGSCFWRGRGISVLLGSVRRLAFLLLSSLLLRKRIQAFLALLNQYRWVVYGAAIASGALVVTVSYVGEIGMISSKRPDIMLYSTSMIFLCFHLFSKMKHVPKIMMFISNYSFSIYLLHAYFMIIGYVLLLNMPEIPAVPAVLLLFAVYSRPDSDLVGTE